jgi:tetratricopeptide (TPR) repeat protein
MEHICLPPLTDHGEVVTFYSYKGGAGRTMALSNVAVLLARRHNATAPVLMLDWDLESPGLHHYFDHHEERPGVLELFEACREQLKLRHSGVARDDEELAQQVLAAVGWEQYVSKVDHASQLYLMRAGRFDDSYGERVAALQWEQLFHSCPALFRCFAANLARHFRYVLVDSRAGRTDSSAVCTTLLPRKLVVMFTPNRQSLEGVRALVTRATTYRVSHEEEQRPLLVYPLPSRIEMLDGQQRSLWRRGAPQRHIPGYQLVFEQLLGECYSMQQLSLENYFDEVQLQQSSTYSCGELVAARVDPEGDRFSLTRSFEAFLGWLADGHLPWQSSSEIELQVRIAETRRKLDQGGGRALNNSLAHELNQLGELHRRDGQLRQAQTCFEESMALRQRALGEDDAETLVSKANLAVVLRIQGRLDEAQFIEECVVEARQRLLGREHFDTLAARANLAATLAQQGRVAEALAMQDTVLDAYLRMLGPEHMLTLACKAGRADMLFQRGDTEHARIAQEQVLVSRKRLLGAEHADTLRSKTALACTLVRMQELDAARSLFDAVLQAQLHRHGPDHPETRKAREQLIDVQIQLGGEPADKLGVPLMVPEELHQDAAMDDYSDALSRPLRAPGAVSPGDLWSRTTDELLALEGHMAAARAASR